MRPLSPHRRFPLAVLFVLLSLLLPIVATAQERPGVLTGTVSDAQHGVIVGASVDVSGPATRHTVTDQRGEYRVELPAGSYQLSVRAAGFEPASLETLSIGPGAAVGRDVELRVAGASEIVSVTAPGFVDPSQSAPATQSVIRKSAITLLGSAAQSNIYKPLELLPSVHVETPDPYGLTSRQPWNLRVRGQAGIGTSLMVEGIPVWAVESPGPRVDMLDLENIDVMTLVRGGVPANQGFGAQDTAGALDIRLMKPAEQAGAMVTQSLGSWDFARTYARLDSGRLKTGTSLFGSYSHSEADKWRGSGAAPKYREHGSFGIQQRLSSAFDAAVFADINQQEQNAFRGLTYAQIQDLATNASLDYNTALTGTLATDANYFGFNRSKTRDVSIEGSLLGRLAQGSTLTVRPYYWSEDQPVYSAQTIPGAGVQGVRHRQNVFNRGGAVAEVAWLVAGTRITTGYWYESFRLAIAEKYYNIATNGDLVFNRWTLDQPSERGVIQSPYVTASRTLGPLHLEAGLRYFHLKNPGQSAYVTPSTGDMSYSDALATGGSIDATASYAGNTQAPWLPYLGATYDVTPNVTAYANYGRNYARSQGYPELMQTYLGARAAYTAAGVDMQYLYNQFRLATSNNYELGARMTFGPVHVVPSFFTGDFHNKLLTIFDPAANRAIRQAVGHARTRGGELEVSANPWSSLAVYSSLSYDRAELRDDLVTALNTVLAVKGKQTPDTPRVLAKIGATYTLAGASISPAVRYVDSRFGDALNTQRVPSYTVTDLNVAYELKRLPGLSSASHLGGLTLSLSAQNLFDRRYVAVIGAFEDSQSGSYFVGARRTIAVRLGASFGR